MNLSIARQSCNIKNKLIRRVPKEDKKSQDIEQFLNELSVLKNIKKLEEDVSNCNVPVVILLDIDDLTLINEIYGLKIGNKIIKSFVEFLKEFALENDYSLYRIYGDGFVLFDGVEVLDITKYLADIMELFNNIKKLIFEFDDKFLCIDVTAGISIANQYPIETAQIALNYAKLNKKDYIIYSNKLSKKDKGVNYFNWKKKIKYSIDQNNILPVYQAIVDKDQNIVKYETLMRIKDEDNLITPYHFMDTAIKSKQYPILSEYIILKALSDAKYSPNQLSVNLTFTDIKNYKFVELMEDYITVNNIGEKLIFEIVENEEVSDFNLLFSFITRFRQLGVKIAIDDFGTGFSNFEYILKIKPDYLKIDGSLIKKILFDKDTYILVESIISLAHNLGIKVISEFVANKEIYEALKKLNVDEYQGFYFYKPEIINFEKEAIAV